MTAQDPLQAKLDAALARAREVMLREFLQEHKDDPELWGEAEAAPVAPKRLDQVFSLRLDGELAGLLRERATANGESASGMIRRVVAESCRPRGFACEHASISGAWLVSAHAPCGCEMHPVYASVTG